MRTEATTAILRNIFEVTFGTTISATTSLVSQLPNGWTAPAIRAIHTELNVSLMPDQIETLSLIELSPLVESRLERDSKGQSLVDIFVKLGELANATIYHEISYKWFSGWDSDLFNESDSLERAEIIMRMEEEFGFSISEQDVPSLETVGQTVRYLWNRSSESAPLATSRTFPADKLSLLGHLAQDRLRHIGHRAAPVARLDTPKSRRYPLRFRSQRGTSPRAICLSRFRTN